MAAARNLAARFISDLSSSALYFYNCARNMTIYVYWNNMMHGYNASMEEDGVVSTGFSRIFYLKRWCSNRIAILDFNVT